MFGWVNAYDERGAGPQPGTYWAHYSLKSLADRGVLSRGAVNRFLNDASLNDYSWSVLWSAGSEPSEGELLTMTNEAQGFAIFVHGWTGSRAIWEDLPAMTVRANPHLLAITIDHNGFGETPFVQQMPTLELCDPPAAMAVLAAWIELVGLRRPPGDPRPRVINLVGHSMGGAALFYLDESQWRLGECTRLALAPALLLHDESHRLFYDTLGLGIGIAGRIGLFEVVERRVEPRILEILASGASNNVVAEHRRIYANTPHGVIARTLAAMGMIRRHPAPHHWELMRVFLGHHDPLVGLGPMLDLLDELTFDVNQIRVVLGTHYFFSVGSDSVRTHTQNRRLVLEELLWLHQAGLRQQSGK